MWGSIASVLLGAAGWVIAGTLGKPWLDFLNLRTLIHEEMTVTANIVADNAHRPEHDRAVEALRRLGARLQAIEASSSGPLLRYLACRGYDLAMAGKGLIGISNSLTDTDGSKALHRTHVERGLKLPRAYTDADITSIKTTMLSRDRMSSGA